MRAFEGNRQTNSRREGTHSSAGRALATGIALTLTIAMGGCGSASAGGTSGSASATVTDCGTLTRHGPTMPALTQDASRVVSCFYQAYQHCSPATISVTDMGVDAGATRTLKVTGQKSSSGSGCTVTDSVHTYVISTHSNTTHTYTCAAVTEPTSGTLVAKSCGADGNVTVQYSPGS